MCCWSVRTGNVLVAAYAALKNYLAPKTKDAIVKQQQLLHARRDFRFVSGHKLHGPFNAHYRAVESNGEVRKG